MLVCCGCGCWREELDEPEGGTFAGVRDDGRHADEAKPSEILLTFSRNPGSFMMHSLESQIPNRGLLNLIMREDELRLLVRD